MDYGKKGEKVTGDKEGEREKRTERKGGKTWREAITPFSVFVPLSFSWSFGVPFFYVFPHPNTCAASTGGT